MKYSGVCVLAILHHAAGIPSLFSLLTAPQGAPPPLVSPANQMPSFPAATAASPSLPQMNMPNLHDMMQQNMQIMQQNQQMLGEQPQPQPQPQELMPMQHQAEQPHQPHQPHQPQASVVGTFQPPVVPHFPNKQPDVHHTQPQPSLLNAFTNMGPKLPNHLKSKLGGVSNNVPHAPQAAAANAVDAPTNTIVTKQMRLMAGQWAVKLGHAAYYAAHGCVDPLAAGGSKIARFGMMAGCNSVFARQACDMASMARPGKMAQKMQMMKYIMPEAYKKYQKTMAKCLSPSQMMTGMTGMFGGKGSTAECGAMQGMLMAQAGEISEAMEGLGATRHKYLDMTCQENVLLGMLPYRLCCPGYVRPPTMQEAMMLKSSAGA